MTCTVELTGNSLIGDTQRMGRGTSFWGINPATAEKLMPEYRSATAEDIDLACRMAAAFFESYRSINLDQRAFFLEAVMQL